ncbi:aminotransferase class V-fold PLP-dependent enzyme [Metabacillus litoralis]|uniref:Aminotransferase class V-fold PLP-dependent enzyme n=1 Tax=Metabacillus litoralis TaxID=152268 RepID=A0A5C6VZM5_9BACI|nr:IscS subfamily cysteine desulfurase [Metabacillus litoralis]TXC90079.1 aminotransferase class V-fold PLP-dependent enzyme [Metabacillus litoralis]
MIYLDYAATTPISDSALDIYCKVAKTAYGNSSSLHDIGDLSARTLAASRKIIANLLGANEKGIFFTGGGSEANILTIQSLLKGLDSKKNHIITTQIEHSSLHTFFKTLASKGYDVTFLMPDENGHISVYDLQNQLKQNTGLVSIQHGNSEIGSIQPLKEIGQLLKNKDILFHSDCVQTFGKLPISVENSHLDAISISAHKIYGPKGIGAAYINPAIHWQPLIAGTTHESGFRPGTVDVPSAAAFATAAQEIISEMEKNTEHFLQLKNHFISLLEPYKDKIILLTENIDQSLPNILPIVIKGIEGQYTMLECNRHGYAISTGSACQVGMQAPSRPLTSIGFDEQQAKQYIRISLGKQTTKQQIENFTQTLYSIVKNF